MHYEKDIWGIIMSEYFGKSWYLPVFVAVMGAASGWALEGDYSYVHAALGAAGSMEGSVLLGLSLQTLLLNLIVLLWPAVAGEAAPARAMAAPAIWLKAMLVGLACRGLLYGGIELSGLIMCLLTAIGGGAVCASLPLRAKEQAGPSGREARRLRLYLWAAGTITEGILVPSVARTAALLFM